MTESGIVCVKIFTNFIYFHNVVQLKTGGDILKRNLLKIALVSLSAFSVFGVAGLTAQHTEAAINWMKPSQTKAYPTWSKMTNPWVYVSTKNQKVYIHGNSKVQYTMYCSTGTKSSPTPKGTYHIQQERGLSFYNPFSNEGARYWVSWKGHGIYLFHSVPINKLGTYLPSEAKYLGKKAHSHGCIRLSVADAKWMYKTIPYGTKIVIK